MGTEGAGGGGCMRGGAKGGGGGNGGGEGGGIPAELLVRHDRSHCYHLDRIWCDFNYI